MSRNGITFVGLVLFVAIINGQLMVAVYGIAAIVLGWFALYIVFKAMKETGTKSEFVTHGYNSLRLDKPHTVNTLDSNLVNAEQQVIAKLAAPGDTLDKIYSNFCYFTGILQEGQTLPNYFSRVVMQRILFEYYKKHGDLRSRFLCAERLPVASILGRMDEHERQNFHHFCIHNT
jgi:hypothetical protein